MSEFFRGWRRKVGCVTLVLACIAATAWVRSYVLFEKFCYRIERFSTSHQHLYSTNGQIWWSRLLEEEGGLHCRWHYSSKSSNVIICNAEDITWRWKAGEFEFGEFPDIGIGKVTYAIIPYWSIVLPLTIISAFLLLSRSGKTTPKEILEPGTIRSYRAGDESPKN